MWHNPVDTPVVYPVPSANIIDESDDCMKPNEVCMQFGMSAQFIIDRKLGRKISKDEAMNVLVSAEEAGLVHASINRQDIDFLCNCCGCHCIILKTALAQPKPGLSLNSGFKPQHDRDLCTSCGTCVDRCPTQALAMDNEDKLELNLDRCIGCGVCATGCTSDAISLVERAGILAPPPDQDALRDAIKASQV